MSLGDRFDRRVPLQALVVGVVITFGSSMPAHGEDSGKAPRNIDSRSLSENSAGEAAPTTLANVDVAPESTVKSVPSVAVDRPESRSHGAARRLRNIERLDGTRVTRLSVRAAGDSGTLGTVASGPLGPAMIYDSEPTGYISGCWDHICAFGFADELRFANIPPGGSELRSYSFSYAAGYGFLFEYCIPGNPAGGDCDCYCPTGGECDEGDPPYTVDAAIYDGPPGLCGGGLPIPGTDVQFQTTASRPLGDKSIEVRVDLEPKVFVPPVVWAVVTLDIEDAWLPISAAPVFGTSTQDGALWIDSDSDGCMDEWDCWPDPYGWHCPGCTGWVHFDAEANATHTVSLIPVSADAPPEQYPPPDGWSISDNEIIMVDPGRPVWLEIRVSDWDPGQTGILVKAFQACVDPSGFTNTDEPPPEPPECSSDDDCQSMVGWGSFCDMPPECADAGFTCGQCAAIGMPCLCTPADSLFLYMPDCTITANCIATLGSGAFCNGSPWPPGSCSPAFINSGRADHIFYGSSDLSAAGYCNENIGYGSTVMGLPVASPGHETYGGTLVLGVPSRTRGTFEIDLAPPPDTLLLNGDNERLPLLGLVPAKITVQTGACCFGLGVDDKKQGCIDDVTVAECEYIGLCKGYCEDNVGFRCQSDVGCELQGAAGPCIGGATLGQPCYPSGPPPANGTECDTAAGETCVIQGGAVLSPNASCGDPSLNCFGCSLSDPPTTEVPAVATNRYLSLVPANAGRRSALRVTFSDLPAPYDAWNQVSMWVGPPVEYCENSGQDIPPPEGCGPAPGQVSETFFASTLQCDPFFMDWQGVCISSSCTGGLREGETCAQDTDCASTIHVYHEGIVPSGGMPADPESFVPASYDVQAVDYACDVSLEDNYSASLTMTNSKWGDTVGDCATQPCSPPNRRVNVTTDITALVNNFQNLPTAPSQARSDLVGSAADALVDQKTMIVDLTAALQAFTGLGYPPATFPPLGDRPCGAPP